MGKINIDEWIARNSKEFRYPEVEAFVKALKHKHGFQRIGAIGFCWGGWAAFQLGAKGTIPQIHCPIECSHAHKH